MEWQNDYKFEYEATMNRLYIYFSDLLDKDLDVKNHSDCHCIDGRIDNE